MLPSETDPIWTRILNGEIQCQFSHVGTCMLLAYLKRSLVGNARQEKLNSSIHDLRTHLLKYEPLLRSDIERIFGHD